MSPFARAQAFSKLHHTELGCLPDGLEARQKGHVAASGDLTGAGIEENGGAAGSHTGEILKNLLRAIAYVDESALSNWDEDLVAARGKLGTGDLDYQDDPMI